ncbi:hypothetical protein GGR57DRAFT_496403 [Xylariaceae sp. FL1272]|nr:hypothetical protein GGR57DRAFT_496403 [Xylariaceae sp. FL1272]
MSYTKLPDDDVGDNWPLKEVASPRGFRLYSSYEVQSERDDAQNMHGEVTSTELPEFTITFDNAFPKYRILFKILQHLDPVKFGPLVFYKSRFDDIHGFLQLDDFNVEKAVAYHCNVQMVNYSCNDCGKMGYGLKEYRDEPKLSSLPTPPHNTKATIKAILMHTTKENKTYGQAAILTGRVHSVNTETSGEVMVFKGTLHCEKKIQDERITLRGYLCHSSTSDGKALRVKGYCRLARENKKTWGALKDKLLLPFRRDDVSKED